VGRWTFANRFYPSDWYKQPVRDVEYLPWQALRTVAGGADVFNAAAAKGNLLLASIRESKNARPICPRSEHE
jgi:hypothetical protein